MYVALLLFMAGCLMNMERYVIGTPLATLCANIMRSLV